MLAIQSPYGCRRLGSWPTRSWATLVALAVSALVIGLLSLAGPGMSLDLVAATLAMIGPHEWMHGYAARRCGAQHVEYRVGAWSRRWRWLFWGPHTRWYGAIPVRRRALIALAPQALTPVLVGMALMGPHAIREALLLTAFANLIGGGQDFLNAWTALRLPADLLLVVTGDPEVDGLYAPSEVAAA